MIHSYSVCSQIGVISSGAWDGRRLLLGEEDRNQQNRHGNFAQEAVEECERHHKKGNEDEIGDDDERIPGRESVYKYEHPKGNVQNLGCQVNPANDEEPLKLVLVERTGVLDKRGKHEASSTCLLYTSDAADE